VIENIAAYQSDWPPITVEGYSEAKNKVIMVFNFDVTTKNKVQKVTQYVVGRAVWCSMNIPAKVEMVLSFDFRGQNIPAITTQTLRDDLMTLLNKSGISNQISIDFLT
jgi:hypothetical protein